MANLTTQVAIAGNLTRDPEVRFTQAGQPVASFTVACTPRSFNKETKQYEDGEPLFQNCVLWGKPAEHFAESAQKGTRVVAVGSLKSRTYQTKEGETKNSVELTVDEIGMSITFSAIGATRAPRVDSYPATGGPSQVPDQDDVPW